MAKPSEPKAEVEALHLQIAGRVQGVGFRFFVEDLACEAGLVGWVRNRPGGAVEIFAQGAPEKLHHFVEEVRQGPPLSRVEKVDATPFEPDHNLTEFSIRT